MQSRYLLQPSPLLAWLLLLMHLLALSALFALSLPLWGSMLLSLCVLSSLVYWVSRAAWLRLTTSCVSIRLHGDMVELHYRNGESVSGVVQRDTLVMPWLVVLNVLPPGARRSRSVVIAADALAPEALRELRVALRWKY
ncbi:MAG TPA: protein YgfX [Gallionellaceae bacterium]|nr:protein YgfX [Gallionellaceae bacterium]